MHIIAYCDSQYANFITENTKMSKRNASFLIVFSDVATIIIFIFAQGIIFYMQKDFSKQYDSQTVEARDFTVVINQIPESFRQNKNEFSMKFSLWNEIQDGISLAKKMGMCTKKIDPTILSIDFGYKSNTMLDHKKKVSQKCREIELL